MNAEDNVLILITGVSCSGKSSVGAELLKRGMKSPYNFTTREIRANHELDEYVFLTNTQFNLLKEEGRLAESVTYGDKQYGVTKYGYEGITFQIVEPNGREILKKAALNKILCDTEGNSINVEVKEFYIKIDEATQKARLEGRGDSEEEVEKRKKDFEWFIPSPSSFLLNGTVDSDKLASLIIKTIGV